MVILIPAYEPGDSLLALVKQLRTHPSEPSVVVIDDGSGPDYDEAFALSAIEGATVVRYRDNQGKGYALKVGFQIIERSFPNEIVVCADSDGQHTVDDIMMVAGSVRSDDEMVLGGRRFTGQVPARSLVGNRVTAFFFKGVTGVRVNDTQTGLRGYPPSMLPWLQTVNGDRFEYELSLLLEAKAAGHGIREVPIEAIYLAENASSHFRPIQDSWRVYKPLLAFSASSVAGFVVDAAVLFALVALTGHLLLSAVLARVISATTNYLLNRHVTFKSGNRSSLPRYAALAVAIFAVNYALLATLHLALPLVLAKVITEVVLFAASFAVQRRFVFTVEPTVERETVLHR